MSLVISTASVVLLILIAYQDFKFRAVTWYFFPLLAVTIVFNDGANITMKSLEIFLLNLTFLLLQLAMITLYFSVKNKTFVKIWHSHLGLGDILFFVVLCLFFSPVNFMLFYLASLMVAIPVVLMLQRFYTSWSLIPLAGMQSSLLAILIIINMVDISVNYRVDVDLTNIF